MRIVRGILLATLAFGTGPGVVGAALAEPRAAVANDAMDAPLEARPAFKLVPTVAAANAAVPAQLPVSVAAAVAEQPAPPPKPVVTLQAKVDLGRQTLTVLEHGKTVGVWKISSGGSAEFATPRGLFKPEWSAKMWYSKKYDDAPMPHAVFFKGGAAIHATQAVGRLGTPASHGCVRLAPGNAATFYGLVQRHGLVHTQIHVFGSPSYPQYVASSAPTSQRRGASNDVTAWGMPVRSTQYANASPFAGPIYYYARLPISAARVR